MEVIGSEHLPYAILALVTFFLSPSLLLLLLYPLIGFVETGKHFQSL